MRVAVGSDEEGALVDAVLEALLARGHDVVRVAVSQQWPEVGRRVAGEVASGRAGAGVVCCWTGTGVSIAANKVSGVRAALCADAATAAGARRWNDANVLAMSIRSCSAPLAKEIVEAFLDASPSEDAGDLAAIARVEGPI